MPTAARRQDFEKFRAERAPLLSRFACFEVLRHKFSKPWWEWPAEWRQPDEANCAAPARRARTGPRSNSSNSCNGPPTGSSGLAGDLRANARHEGRPLSRRRGRRAVRRLRCLERAGRDLAPSRRSARRRIRSTPPARTGASPASMPPAWSIKSFAPYRDMLRASMRHAGAIRLDHVLGLKRLYLVPHGFSAARRRLCADAVRGAAGGDRAGKRRASLRRDRRRSRHRAGRLSRADGRLGHLVVSW